MAGNKRWTDEENQVFLDVLPQYRRTLVGEDDEGATLVTTDFAKKLYSHHSILREYRTENAVFEHLPYMDDLLAGVGDPFWYAMKDARYFGKSPRDGGNTEMNKTKRRPYRVRTK